MKQKAVNKTIKEFLSLKSQEKEAKTKAAEKLKEISDFANLNNAEFTDGKLALDEGVISIKLNPPKLIHQGSGKNLTTEEQTTLLAVIPEEYHETKPNRGKMLVRVAGDKVLKQALKAEQVEVVQDTRYDVKGY